MWWRAFIGLDGAGDHHGGSETERGQRACGRHGSPFAVGAAAFLIVAALTCRGP
jgi:hypothetical protein